MTDAKAQCLCVVDTDGLFGIAKASGNLQVILLDYLKGGVIGVPVAAWQEFEELYEDEAAALKQYVMTRIIMKRAYYVGAARIADKLNSGFPRGSHDDSVELIVASIAATNGYRILTSTAQLPVYKEMKCEAFDLETGVEELSASTGEGVP